MCTYPDQDQGQIDWARWTAASGWTLQADVPIAGKAITESAQLACDGALGTLVAVLSDSNGQLFSASCDGSSWTLLGPVLETNLASTRSLPFGVSREGP